MSYPQYPRQQAQTWQGGEPPLWAPYYGAPFPAAVKRFFKKYATFSGRASLSEFWWWTLVSVGVGFILNIPIIGASIDDTSSSTYSSTPAMGAGATIALVFIVIWSLATLVPSLALTVRRLHDSNKSGWMILLGLIPFGSIILLVLVTQGSDPAGQRFDQPVSP